MRKQKNTELLYAQLTYLIRSCLFEIRRQYGPGQKEVIYQRLLEEKLKKIGLRVKKEPKIKIYSQDSGKVVGIYQPDLLVEDKIILEIKSSRITTKTDERQLYHYLRNSQYQLGLLINFSTPKLYIKRIIYTNDRKLYLPCISVFPSVFFSVLISAFLLFFPLSVFGQQVSLSLSPPLLEVFIKPGKSIVVAYNLQNFGDPTILTAKVLPFEAKDNLGNIRIKEEFEGPVRFSLDNADLQLEQPFFLKTGDRQQLLLRLRIPEGAPEGDYYYTLLVKTQPPSTTEGVASSRAQATIGSNILITVTESGMVQVKGKIALFDVLPRWKLAIGNWKLKLFDSNDKIPLVAIVENQGKNLIKPEGEIILKGNFGEKAKYQIIPQNILAESQRLLTATPSAEFDCPSKGKQPVFCRQPITLLLSGFFIGRYNLSTYVNFGETSPKVFASTSFVALPFKFLLGLIIAISLAILLFKRATKNE